MSKQKRILLIFLSLLMFIPLLFNSLTVHAVSEAEAYQNLVKAVRDGKYGSIDYTNSGTKKSYKTTGGGYKTYTEITKPSGSVSDVDIFSESVFSTLTPKAKQDFLKDMLRIGNQMVADTAAGKSLGGSVTEDTLNNLLDEIQSKLGMGSQLLATLLSETKPNYATANRIYKPFSGVVGTILGVLSIVVMSLLGITMALDICYIVIPAFQLMMGNDSQSGNDKGTKGMSKLISIEARNAVNAVESSGGSGGQNGSDNKAALGIYFKYRWKGLVLLGICLLYLVQGQIYSFVSWIIDLLSGFLGF